VFLLTRFKSKWTKISSLSLIGIGVLGVSLSFYVGLKVARDFNNKAEIQEEIVNLTCSQLEVKTVFKNIPALGKFKQVHSFNSNSPEIITFKNDRLFQGGIKFIYRPSKDSNFHVFQKLTANGFSYSEAIQRAKNIKSAISIDSNTLSINPEYSYPSNDKIRLQSVCIIIEIPQNKYLKFEDHLIGFDISSSLTYEKQGYLNHKGNYDNWD
jgi:hypothetical protein